MAARDPVDSPQLSLDIRLRPPGGAGPFLVGCGNAEAFQRVMAWPDWPGHALVVQGDGCAGKTHLCLAWQVRSDAVVGRGSDIAELLEAQIAAPSPVAVDDIDSIAGNPEAERALLHLYNLVGQHRRHLLMTARQAPARIAWGLPDLRSRLRSTVVAMLRQPDDTLLRRLLTKLFEDRQLAVAPDVPGFLARRIERSFAAAVAVVDRFDREGLRLRRPVTVPLARELLKADTPPIDLDTDAFPPE